MVIPRLAGRHSAPVLPPRAGQVVAVSGGNDEYLMITAPELSAPYSRLDFSSQEGTISVKSESVYEDEEA